ncbi:porin [Xylophilus sp.]|uniref:porin n=1 Tax=Xylophilus sp. TaxID=2653893 RepID=UPI0013BBBE0E|nr:porin [Xylophilus sp.]KAF1049805.1 MAG: Outer membrane porin protein 32 [Xylophilus sp.]
MKKSLIALAVLAASGAAMAQSSVTLFGVVDAGVSRLSSGGKSVTGLSNSGNAGSRLGFRGIEDLGGGLKAGFWLEGAISNDSGTGAGAGAAGPGFEFKRRATVSLLGNFGELRLGRDFIAAYNGLVLLGVDPFGDLGVGAFGSLFYNTRSANGFENRKSNTVNYFLPANLGGFYGQAQFIFGERASSTVTTANGQSGQNGNGYSFNLGYKNGPLAVGGAYTKLKHGHVITHGTSALATDTDNINLAASYDFGFIKPVIAVNQEKNDAFSETKYRNYLLGLTAPVGPGTIKFSYIDTNDKSALKQGDAQKYALGYQYDLSKRTALYATYAHVKNKGTQATPLNANGISGVTFGPGSSGNGYDFGLRHSF